MKRASAILIAVLSAHVGAAAEAAPVAAAVTNALPSLGPEPDYAASLLRVLGALILVLGVFFTGVWVFRNWQNVVSNRGRTGRLKVLETKSLGGRFGLFVIAYGDERLLLGTSPNGVNLLTHLPADTEGSPDPDARGFAGKLDTARQKEAS